MTFKSIFPVKKSKEEIQFYIENGPKFGNILYSLYKKIRDGELIYPEKIIMEYETMCNKEFKNHYTFYPFKIATNNENQFFGESICISVNEVAAHGNTKKRFEEGDVVSIDCGLAVSMDVFKPHSITPLNIKYLHFDAAFTTEIGPKQNWIRAPWSALKMVAIGQPKNTYELAAIIENICEIDELSNVISLTGHGIGYNLHEPPIIHNAKGDYLREELFEGLCFCAEPVFAKRKKKKKLIERTYIDSDGWAISTQSGSPTSHFETMFCKHEGKIIDLLGVTKWSL